MLQHDPKPQKTFTYTAVIGDIVKSRSHVDADRDKIQLWLQDRLDTINNNYKAFIAAQFLITLGDEFQGLLKSASVVPEIYWILQANAPVDIRFGVGKGVISTTLKEFAIGADGPAWYRARDAIDTTKRQPLSDLTFKGFGETADQILNALSVSLSERRSRLKPTHRSVFNALRRNATQADVASTLRVTPQFVSHTVHSQRWDVYRTEEEALTTLLLYLDNKVMQ